MNEKVTDKARGMFEKATGYVFSLFASVLLWGGGFLWMEGELCCAVLYLWLGNGIGWVWNW